MARYCLRLILAAAACLLLALSAQGQDRTVTVTCRLGSGSITRGHGIAVCPHTVLTVAHAVRTDDVTITLEGYSKPFRTRRIVRKPACDAAVCVMADLLPRPRDLTIGAPPDYHPARIIWRDRVYRLDVSRRVDARTAAGHPVLVIGGAAYQGESGSPVWDTDGRLVGLVSAGDGNTYCVSLYCIHEVWQAAFGRPFPQCPT